MANASATADAMDAIEIAEFMHAQSTGVLSLAKDDDGYAIPVSFAYEDEGPYVYFRLGYAPGSQKRMFVDAVETVSFVVYDDTEEGWKSVVARGRLEGVAETTLESSIAEAVRGLDIPYFKVFDRPADEIEFDIARIDVTDLNGVVEGPRTR